MDDCHINALKKGFLVKKRVQKKRWKTCWCVLCEDRLVYYRKKDSVSPTGYFNLHGASIVALVPAYENRKAVFKLCLQDGYEYLFQSPSKEERDIWAMSISAGIRSLGSTAQTESSSFGEVNSKSVSLSEVLVAMQDSEAGIHHVQYHVNGKDFNYCFAGATVVDWLVKWRFATSRAEAVTMAEALLLQAHILLLQSTDKKRPPSASDKTFTDSADVFYRFSSMIKPTRHDAFWESSSDSAGSSDADYSEGDVLDSDAPTPKGKIIKEGFLMKRGYSFRKKWKVRKVVLRDSPPTLEYYSASKNNVQLLKSIPLTSALVVDMDEFEHANGDETGSKRKHVFCLRVDQRSRRTLLTFQAEDKYCKKDWIESLLLICSPPPQAPTN